MTIQDRCVSYGRLGLSRYELQQSHWLFCRQIRPTGLTFSPVSILAQVIHPEQIGNETEQNESDHHRYDNSALSVLLGDAANLAPALHLLPQLDQISEAIQGSEIATSGNLIAIGSITDRHYRTRLGIFVSAGGPAARYLRFDALERVNFRARTSVQQEGLIAYKIQKTTPAWFNCGGDPVLQVIFSDSTTNWGEILAIRHRNRIAILRPFASQHASWHPSNQGFPSQSLFSSSRVHPGHLADIRPTAWGNFDLAYVSFNPWEATEIAAINTIGLLSIWKLRFDSSKFLPDEPIELLLTSRLCGDFMTESDHDGWGRVFWAYDSKTLVIARRRNLALLQMERPSVIIPIRWTSNQDPQTDDWILEADRCPTHPDIIIILTKSSLMFMKMIHPACSAEGSEQLLTGETILSTPHHQIAESIQLHMTTMANGNVITVLLHRTGSEVLSIFTFTFYTGSDLLRFQNNSNVIRVSSWAHHLIDPIRQGQLHVPEVAVHTLSLIPAVKATASNPYSFSQHRSGDQGYVQMVVLTPDMRVFDIMLALNEEPTLDSAIETKLLRPQSRSSMTSFRIKDPFVVEDEVLSDEAHLSRIETGRKQQHIARLMRGQDTKNLWKSLGRRLVEAAETYPPTAEEDPSILDCHSSSEGRARIPKSSNRLYTRYEFLKHPATFANVRNASPAALNCGGRPVPDRLINLEVGALLTLGSETLPLIGLNSFMLQNAGFDDPAVICERLAATCVWPLADSMPSHTRIVLNALIRRISSHMVLSVAGIIVFQDEWRVRRAAEDLLENSPHSDSEPQFPGDRHSKNAMQTSDVNLLKDSESLDTSIEPNLALTASWSTFPIPPPLIYCLGVLEDADDLQMLDVIHDHWNTSASSEGDMSNPITHFVRKQPYKQRTTPDSIGRTHSKSAAAVKHRKSSLSSQDQLVSSVTQSVGSQSDDLMQHSDRVSSQNNQASQWQPSISTLEETLRPIVSLSQSQLVSQSPSLSQRQAKKRKAGFR